MKRRISLRMLMVLVTVAAMFFGVLRYYTALFHRQEQAVQRLAAFHRTPIREPIFPKTGWSQIDRLYRVVECDLSRAEPHLIEQVAHLPFLKVLDLRGSEISDDQAKRILPRCSRLRVLNLLGTNISRNAIQGISRLHALESLHIDYLDENAETLPQLLELPNLQHLNCSFPLRTQQLRMLGAHPHVRCATLNCDGVTVADLDHLSQRNSEGTLRLHAVDIDENWEPVFSRLNFFRVEVFDSKVNFGLFSTYQLRCPILTFCDSLRVEEVFDHLDSAAKIVFREGDSADRLVVSVTRPNGIEQDVWIRHSRGNHPVALRAVRAEFVGVWDPRAMYMIDERMFIGARSVYLDLAEPRHLDVVRACKRVRDLHMIVCDELPSRFKTLPELEGLEVLKLSVDPFSNETMTWIVGHQGLRELELSVERLDLATLRSLATLPRLESLTLDGNDVQLSDQELVEIIRSLPAAKQVTVNWTLGDFSNVQGQLPNVNLSSFDD